MEESFRESIYKISFPTIELNKLIFNAEPIGPIHPFELGKVKCNKGFRLVTMPELVQLTCACLKNSRKENAGRLVEILQNYLPGASIISNTGIFHADEGMYVQDNPEIRDGRIYINSKKLRTLLKIKNTEEKVIISNQDIRFTSEDFNCENFSDRSFVEFMKNPGASTVVGGQENLNWIVEASKFYCNNNIPHLIKSQSPKDGIMTAGLSLFHEISHEYNRILIDLTCWGNCKVYTFEVQDKNKNL